jgi:hypothetical protein
VERLGQGVSSGDGPASDPGVAEQPATSEQAASQTAIERPRTPTLPGRRIAGIL